MTPALVLARFEDALKTAAWEDLPQWAHQVGREDLAQATRLHAMHPDEAYVAQGLRILICVQRQRNDCQSIPFSPQGVLLFAVHMGLLPAVKVLLEEGVSPILPEDAETSLLHKACQHGKVALVQALLSHGCDVNATPPRHDAPISVAARFNHQELIEFLIRQGADLDKGSDDRSVLADACLDSDVHPDTVRLLVRMGADPDAASVQEILDPASLPPHTLMSEQMTHKRRAIEAGRADCMAQELHATTQSSSSRPALSRL